jgi:hypothetical protein
MRTEEEIRQRRNKSHYSKEVECLYRCEIDGHLCEEEPIGGGDGPDCSECEKHKGWVLNDKEEK